MIQQVKKVVRSVRKRVLVARGGAPSGWYDEIYSQELDYNDHYSKSRYLPVWEALCDRIGPGSSVLEIGCGPGQLAHMMRDRDLMKSYVGFDFSETAIDLARERVPGYRLEVADARSTDLYTAEKFDVAIATEVLEHILDDLMIVERIPRGTLFLGTVPNFDYTSHVRWFESAEQVRERYGSLFESLEITTHFHAGDVDGSRGTFYLLSGRR